MWVSRGGWMIVCFGLGASAPWRFEASEPRYLGACRRILGTCRQWYDVGGRSDRVGVDRKIVDVDVGDIGITDGVSADYQGTNKPLSSPKPSNLFCKYKYFERDKEGSNTQLTFGKVRLNEYWTGPRGRALGRTDQTEFQPKFTPVCLLACSAVFQ